MFFRLLQNFYFNNQKIITDFFYHGFASFYSHLCGFIALLFISRYLGPTQLGLFSFTITFYVFFLIALSGIESAYMWHLKNIQDKDKEEYIKNFILYKFIFSLLLTLLGLLIAWLFFPVDVFFLSIAIFLSLPLSAITAFNGYALMEKRSKVLAWATFLAYTFSLIVKLSLVYFKLPLIYFLIVAGLDTILASSIIFIYFIREKRWFNLVFSKYNLSFLDFFKYLFEVKYAILYTIFFQSLLRVDQIILAKLTNAYSVGIYTSAVKIAEIPNMLAGILFLTFMSRMKDISVDKEKMKKSFILYFVSSLIAFLFIYIFAEILINLIYGKQFIEAISVLKLYALSIPAVFMCIYINSFFLSREDNKTLSMVYGAAFFLNILLVIVLTPIYYLHGTALAAVFTYYFCVIVLFVINFTGKKF